MKSQQFLDPFDAFCVRIARETEGKAGDLAPMTKFGVIPIRDENLAPRYKAGDDVPIDFETEPLVGQWGYVELMLDDAGASGYFGVIRRRDRRGVVIDVFATLWPEMKSSLRFVAAGRFHRVGWARPWDADNVLLGFIAWKAKQRAA